MLRKLQIQNYAIIDELGIEFSGKLNIITGETGAGKSILMGALGLVLGERADTTVLQDKDRKCFVEALFLAEGREQIQAFLKENDLDAGDELVIRREIAANGKSRAFVNDTPVNLSQLRQLSLMLVDLHQQFDTLELNSAGFQQEVLDALSGNLPAISEYRREFQAWQQSRKELEALQQQQAAANAALDYNQFLFDELEEAGF
ncbi:MAG TPA: AAA family ATPase, partial [Ferruginibacter sp.]|nr:AAA family ATPase [Ferruginibacter sp.]